MIQKVWTVGSLWNLLFKILLFVKDTGVNGPLKKLPDGGGVVSNTLGIDFVCLWQDLVPASSEGPSMGTRQDLTEIVFFPLFHRMVLSEHSVKIYLLLLLS